MAGKKINPESLISLELKKFEDKFNQFQQYLEQNTIVTQVTKNDEILLSEENQDKLHKEITMQIRIQDAILAWMPLLEKLKAGSQAKQQEMRGDAKVGGMYKKELGDGQ